MKILIGGPRRNSGIPWWLIVGGLGFLIFGGWKGFFGAIAGVLIIPVILLIILALGFFVLSLFIARRHSKSQRTPPFSDFTQSGTENAAGDVVNAEATVIRTEKTTD